MARRLKTYETSLGFFDMAIAAPSMKAALDAWGSKSNLFHQGLAHESQDRDVIAATMARPGVVLRRPVGSNGRFTEHADLPTDISGERVRDRPKKSRSNSRKQPPRNIDDRTARKAAREFERVQRQRKSEQRKEEAARAKAHERREKAIAEAQAALDRARGEHEEKAARIEDELAAAQKRSQAEEERWQKLKDRLEQEVRRARG